MNPFGLLVGIATLVIIGMGFPLVIHTERVLGYRWWPYMLGAGLALIGCSLPVATDWASVLVALPGAALVWGATELKEQAVRAELGWFPHNARKVRPPFESIIAKWKAPHL